MISAFRSARRDASRASTRTRRDPAAPAAQAPAHAAAPPDALAHVASDADLLARVAAGDRDAFSSLYAAHRPMAEAVARRTCPPSDVDDVVADAFAKILEQVERGGGPRVSFRAYLVTAVRSAAADLARRHSRTFPTDEVDAVGPSAPTAPEQPHSPLRLESQVLATALAELPPRWQLAVWWVTVEQRPLREVGERLGINANAAAALAFRAREGLRDAYLALHVERSTNPRCTPWRADFPALARGRLVVARAADVTRHLDGCAECREVLDRLRDLVVTGVPAA